MIILLICTGMVIANGVTLGSLEIWGVEKISEENDTIDQKNQQLSTLVSVTYPSALTTVTNSAKTMESTKEEYENKALLISNSNYSLQTEEYEIEFLWTKLGNYALDNDVEIKIDVTNSSISGRYDLNFTVDGDYPDVTQFIYDIENDSKLGFKIEKFKMISGSEGVTGTFSCTEIKIDLKDVDTTITVTNTDDTDNTANSSSGTNSTGTSSSSSSTKSTGASSSTKSTTNSDSSNSTTENTTSDQDDIVNQYLND
jgi:hypothetical protein